MHQIIKNISESGVMWITLNRPDSLNAINGELRDALYKALLEADIAGDVRCVAITGAGRAFCAGGDVKEMGDGSPTTSVKKLSQSKKIIELISSLNKPVLAGVNGLAYGAGFNLALACDILISKESAVFSQIFSKRGLVPDMGGCYHLARQVGLYRAKEIMFSGREISAHEARDLGLTAKVWPDDKFEFEFRKYAEQLAASPTVALALTKKIVGRAFESDLAQVLDMEAMAQGVASSTADHALSIAALGEKTSPKFQGR